jgi:hypothetical protein
LLLLVDTCGVALLGGSVDGGLDTAALLLGLCYGFFFCGTRLSAFLASEVLAEVGVCAAMVVEIDSIGYWGNVELAALPWTK